MKIDLIRKLPINATNEEIKKGIEELRQELDNKIKFFYPDLPKIDDFELKRHTGYKNYDDGLDTCVKRVVIKQTTKNTVLKLKILITNEYFYSIK